MPSSLWQRATSYRYTQAAEAYSRHGERLARNRSRAGALVGTAVAARAAHHAESMPEPPPSEDAPPPPPPPPAAAALEALAAGVGTVIGWEQQLTKPFGKIPFPAFPALRVLDFDIGLPHAHSHPPNLTPPNPVPVPLPSTGPILKIPILSGALATNINNLSAARCGDMGIGVWCGGFFPLYEVFLGSATVWVEGARAGRLAVDITKHCLFSVPKPTDPPLGPMIGVTVGMGSPNVMIGGVPLPSLFSLACAGLFKAAFKGAGAVFRRATAKSYVDRLIRSGSVTITGPARYTDDIVADLRKMAQSPTGRNILRGIQRTGRNVEIRPYRGAGHNASAPPLSWDAFLNTRTGAPRAGSNMAVEHTPAIWANRARLPHGHPHPGTPSDAILNHEMNHVLNGMEGRMVHGVAPGDPGPVHTSQGGWDNRWNNFEEYSTTHADNAYRRENGLPLRQNYAHLP